MVVKQFKESVEGVGGVVYDIQDNFIGFAKVLPKKSHKLKFLIGLVVLGGVVYLLHWYWKVI